MKKKGLGSLLFGVGALCAGLSGVSASSSATVKPLDRNELSGISAGFYCCDYDCSLFHELYSDETRYFYKVLNGGTGAWPGATVEYYTDYCTNRTQAIYDYQLDFEVRQYGAYGCYACYYVVHHGWNTNTLLATVYGTQRRYCETPTNKLYCNGNTDCY